MQLIPDVCQIPQAIAVFPIIYRLRLRMVKLGKLHFWKKEMDWSLLLASSRRSKC
jgi:hypothetical protein